VRAVSPDGRIWNVDSLRQPPSLAQARREPFFWISAFATAGLVALVVYFVILDPTSPFLLLGVLPLLVIWVLERATTVLRPVIRAETMGPPPEVVCWKSSARFGRRSLERRAVRAIESGRPPETDLTGLTLVTVD
jgi:hypothetical protein